MYKRQQQLRGDRHLQDTKNRVEVTATGHRFESDLAIDQTSVETSDGIGGGIPEIINRSLSERQRGIHGDCPRLGGRQHHGQATEKRNEAKHGKFFRTGMTSTDSVPREEPLANCQRRFG